MTTMSAKVGALTDLVTEQSDDLKAVRKLLKLTLNIGTCSCHPLLQLSSVTILVYNLLLAERCTSIAEPPPR